MRRTAAQVEQMADRIGFSSAVEIAGAMGLGRRQPQQLAQLDHGGHSGTDPARPTGRRSYSPAGQHRTRVPSLDVVPIRLRAGNNGRVGLIPHSIGASAV